MRAKLYEGRHHANRSKNRDRGASSAWNDEPASEQQVDRQQSENRAVAAMASARQDKNNNEALNNPYAAEDDKESSAGGDDLVQATNDGTGDDGHGSQLMPATSIPIQKWPGARSGHVK